MKPELSCSEPVLESTVAGIVRKDISLFIDTNGYNCFFEGTWATDTIRQNSRLIDLSPENKIYCTAVRIKSRGTGIALLRSVELLSIDKFLIPLGTHINLENNKYKAYELDGNCRVQRERNLSEFLIDRLPDTVTLTRTLSEEEVKKYSQGPEGLGSSHQLFWNDAVHTAVHNITDEFSTQGYERAIKFIFFRDELRRLSVSDSLALGTYNFVFKDRDNASPFPFDLEIQFRRKAFPFLIHAYNRWKDASGVDDIPNPFYNE